jgi:hypothetical protein
MIMKVDIDVVAVVPAAAPATPAVSSAAAA